MESNPENSMETQLADSGFARVIAGFYAVVNHSEPIRESMAFVWPVK